MQTSLFFSLLFFMAFAIELFIGLYILNINPKGKLNKQFFLVTIALCFWSFGFAMGNIAQTLEGCLIWRRFAAVGWTTAYSLLLHLVLVLVGKNRALKKWHYAFLYFPAIVCLFIFAINGESASLQNNLVQVDYGWINMSINNIWDWFFYVYYVSYVLLCIGILFCWKTNSKESRIKKQANIMLASILIIAILGTVNDLIISDFVKSPLPQMAPLFNLIPVFAVLYSVKKNSYMRELAKSEPAKGLDNSILDKNSRSQLYTYLSVLFLVGGILSSLPLFIPSLIHDSGGLTSTIIASISAFLIGALIMIIQLTQNGKIKEFLVIGAILLSIPVTIVRFFDSAAITVWVFPAILMIVALAFNKVWPLISILVVSVITQIIVWINAPARMVRVDDFDFIMRIGLLGMIFGIAVTIHKIYVKRLEQNLFQMNFERLIAELAADLLSINQLNLNEKTAKFLEKTGRLFLVDRAYIFLLDRKQNTVTYTNEWCNQGITPSTEVIQNNSTDIFPWLLEEISTHKLIALDDIDTLPETAVAERDILKKKGALSIAIVPIEQDGNILGFIGFDSVFSKKKWITYHIDLLKTLSHLIADVFSRIEFEKTIEHMAYYDHLTGLPNRALFADWLSQAIETAKISKQFVGVLLLDLDGFKMVNDIMGHSGGDAFLKELSQGLHSRLNKRGRVARFGGDEFLILINNLTDKNDIIPLADIVMELFKQPFFISKQEFYVTASMGISLYPFDGEDAETLIKNADLAMYMAKGSGKNQYVLCTNAMKEEVKRNIQLSNQLYRVQERGEMILYYQPQIKLSTGKITGIEALLRWKHPEFGVISPGIFIPLAEANGTINSIGEWVLRRAVHQNKVWQDKGYPKVRMAVNLSAVQFNNPNLVERVESIIEESGLEPRYLELEITESTATIESSLIMEALNKFKELGISISIDDFGMEHSSLNRLKSLPIDRIKIDMQFVQGIDSCEKDRAITQIIINLAKMLGLEILAEGVETASQLEFLNQKMCDEVQGYYFYKPMPAEEIEDLLRGLSERA